MTMSMKGNGMSDGDKDGELRRTGRHGRIRRAGLLGGAGRIAKSEQVAGLDHPAQFRKPGKFWMKLFGVLTAAALGLTYAGSALANDFTAPDTLSSTDSSVSSDSDTWAGQADGTLDTAPSDASDNTGTNDGSASADASDTQSDATAQPAVKPVAGCNNVQDWAALTGCMSKSGPVTITQTITAGDSITIPANVEVTLTAAVGLDSAINDETAGDGMFIVNGTLTIGVDAEDANFSYKNGKRWLARVNNGGTVVINNGTFSGVDTTNTKYTNGGVLRVNDGGSVTINNGTFSGNKADRGAVIYSDGNSIAVHGGTFDGNVTGWAAGVIMQNNVNGTMVVDSASGTAPRFSNNTSGTKGGAIHNNGTLTISAGTFEGNTSLGAGGGAISQDSGSTVIVPSGNGSVMFKGNAHDVLGDDGKSAVCNTTTGYSDDCWSNERAKHNYGNAGGGAIFASAGKLRVQGKVTFDGNYSRIWGYMVGGGAIFMKGELWVQNDAKGNKPLFTNNYAGVEQRETNADGAVETVFRGGAGGAIFLQEGTVDESQTDEAKKYSSRAYIMGGEFTDNTSGYLGGAIYTESHSLTYVAKAVATANTAGHFGGGLWLCPSGTGEASKGGNIALFDNKVDKSIDPNNEANDSPYPNDTPFGGEALTSWNTGGNDKTYGQVPHDGTEAGDDFAIMNPMWKGEIKKTDFMLMDTWFTDRTQSAVTWYKDGTPVKGASGFQDYFQDPEIQSKGGWHSGDDGGGTNLAVTKTDGRFTGAAGTKIAMDADHTHDIQLTRTLNEKEGVTTGVALKAQKADGMSDEQWTAAKKAALNSAAIVLTGNAARLSGGAFATNGDVKFSTPYTASWAKVDNTQAKNQLAGAEWTVSTSGTGKTEDDARADDKLGGPFNADFYPSMCPSRTDDPDEVAYNAGTCWKETVETNSGAQQVTVTRTAIVKDNIASDKNAGQSYSYAGLDNNPDGGGFDINNLHNGTYTVTETKAPTGYELSAETHTFVVNNAQAKWNDDQGQSTENVDIDIVNTPLKGISWSKMDEDSSGEVGDSEWKITKLDASGNPDTSTEYYVDDCIDAPKLVPCKKSVNSDTFNRYADLNGTAGQFTIEGLAYGTYQLVESKAPDGYWYPTGETVYKFTVPSSGSDSVKIYQADGKTEVTNNAIPNKRTQIEWSKVDANNTDDLLNGSEWTISGPYTIKDGTGKLLEVKDSNNQLLTMADVAVTDCVSKEGATDPCGRHENNLTGKEPHYYADVNSAAGKFKVTGLARPEDKSAIYVYELKETKAPEGYMLSSHTYRFEVGYSQPTGAVSICQLDSSVISKAINADVAKCEAISDNKIPNSKPINNLPLTGGDARSWMFIGTGLALMAALAALATGWVKRRELW